MSTSLFHWSCHVTSRPITPQSVTSHAKTQALNHMSRHADTLQSIGHDMLCPAVAWSRHKHIHQIHNS
eukprot:6460765-Amphidinium_carterae.1